MTKCHIDGVGTLFDLIEAVRSAGRSFVCRRIDRIEIIDIKNNKYYGRGKR